MDSHDKRPVLVAVDDGHAAEAALSFAAAEARRADCGVKLLHVVHPYPTSAEEAVIGQEFVGPAQHVLATLAERVREVLPADQSVTSEVDTGLVVPTIVEHSRKARMVVLQGEDRNRLERLVIGRVRNGVASHASVPVVCVPPDWSPNARPRELVVVGVEDPYRPGTLVRDGLMMAADRGCALRLFNTWWFTEPYDDVVFTSSRISEWTVRMKGAMRQALGQALHDSACEYDESLVEIVARHERPADGLVQESGEATLLVIGRRDPRLPLASHLGPVARSVLARSECPVVTVEAGYLDTHATEQTDVQVRVP